MTLDVKISQRIATIRFSFPSRGCLDRSAIEDLDHALEMLEQDNGIDVIILTGADSGIFIRHYSVEELASLGDLLRSKARLGEDVNAKASMPNRVSQCFARLRTMRQVTIAAINGICLGGGFELALHCDLRIAQVGDYRIGLPEVRLGIIPGAGGTQLLPLLIGEANAKHLILQGESLTPAQALSFNLVSEVVTDVVLRANNIAKRISGLSQAAVGAAKQMINHVGNEKLEHSLTLERIAFARLIQTSQAKLCIDHFNKTGGDLSIFGNMPMNSDTENVEIPISGD